MAALNFVRRGAHALGGGALQFGVNGVVLSGHDVGARLRPPGDPWELFVEQADRRRRGSRPHDLLLGLGEVPRELLDTVWEQPDATVGYLDLTEGLGGRELRLLAGCGLGLVRRERSNVNEAGDTVVGPRCGDDGAAVGVADED